MNNQTSQFIYLVDEQSNLLRKINLKQAQQIAEENGLDLITVSEKDGFPVCKLMDYDKYKYELKKKQAAQKKQQPKNIIKQIRLTPRIDIHDIGIKLKQVKKFLDDNYKVQISVSFKGRESQHKELGLKVLEHFNIEGANIIGPKSENNYLYMILSKGEK